MAIDVFCNCGYIACTVVAVAQCDVCSACVMNDMELSLNNESVDCIAVVCWPFCSI